MDVSIVKNGLGYIAGQVKTDGWVNMMAGYGRASRDKSSQTYFGNTPILQDSQLTNLWIGDGLGKKIVDVVSFDMIRNGWEIPEDENEKISKELERLNAPAKIYEAMNWKKLYRGALIVMLTNDSAKLDKPLPPTVRGIEKLLVYSAIKVEIQETDFVTDPKSKYYGEIEIFRVRTITGNIEEIHRSRCLVFKGDLIPDDSIPGITLEMRYWGMSTLQPIWDRLKNFGGMEHGISNLMYEFVIGVYKLENLAEILAEKDGVDLFYTRMECINASKSMINSVILGKDEDFTRNTASLAGIPEVMDRFMMTLSAVADIPVTRLFGRSPAGENATGESDSRNYYDMVGARQEVQLKPNLMELMFVINKYMNVSTTLTVDFNPVWEPTPAEMLEMKKKQAETDQIYIITGVLSAEEVYNHRFVGGYKFETNIEEGTTFTTPPPPDNTNNTSPDLDQ